MARTRLQTSEFVADSSDPWLSPCRSNDRGRKQKLELASGKMLMKRCLSSKYVVHHPGAPLADKLSISGKSNRSRVFQHHHSVRPPDSSWFPPVGRRSTSFIPRRCRSARPPRTRRLAHAPRQEPGPAPQPGASPCQFSPPAPTLDGPTLGLASSLSTLAASLLCCQRPAVPPLNVRLTHPSPYLAPTGMLDGHLQTHARTLALNLCPPLSSLSREQ